jgi:hypothetical protein
MFQPLAEVIVQESRAIRPLVQTFAVSGNPEEAGRNQYVTAEKQRNLGAGKPVWCKGLHCNKSTPYLGCWAPESCRLKWPAAPSQGEASAAAVRE